MARAQITLSIDYADNDPTNVDSGTCALGAKCFDRGVCPRDGCWDEVCVTGRCNAGQAYCEVDNGGRFRAYLQVLDRNCESDGLNCPDYDCEAYGEWVDGSGSSSAACGQWSNEVICSTTLWSPPPPSSPPSPKAPAADECQKYGCSAAACAAVSFVQTTVSSSNEWANFTTTTDLGGSTTVQEAIDLICAGADAVAGTYASECVDFMDSFDRRESSTHLVRTIDTHRSFADSYLGATWRHICGFAARCEAHCGAEVCNGIIEARGDGGGNHGCTGEGNLCNGIDQCCPALGGGLGGCDSGCTNFLDARNRRRGLVGGFGSSSPPPAFVDAGALCAEVAVRNGWMIAGIVVGVLFVATIAACAYKKGWCKASQGKAGVGVTKMKGIPGAQP